MQIPLELGQGYIPDICVSVTFVLVRLQDVKDFVPAKSEVRIRTEKGL